MTFELPFYSETLAGLFEVIKNEEPARPIASTYDPALIKIVYKMIEKNPMERPTITELLEINFIQDRINKWCSEDPVVREFVEEHITLNR
jgi:serine/threonine protein kinase